ncbi:hypothetical protein [Parafrankia elaeagni]|uniref:hypothetical protein n=1 Tax=Parafrankia elaeagni TaxID=222534 RepID=UPI00035C449D|nr:hypothetical protein [Parafrankia elaeagni]
MTDPARGPAAPGAGRPEDPATASTPVAQASEQVADLAATAAGCADLDAWMSVCRACPRLVAWREGEQADPGRT